MQHAEFFYKSHGLHSNIGSGAGLIHYSKRKPESEQTNKREMASHFCLGKFFVGLECGRLHEYRHVRCLALASPGDKRAHAAPAARVA